MSLKRKKVVRNLQKLRLATRPGTRHHNDIKFKDRSQLRLKGHTVELAGKRLVCCEKLRIT